MITRVYVAYADSLKNQELFDRLYCYVDHERQKKIDRMIFPEGKRLSLGAGALLKAALANEGITDFELTREKHKKPCLKGRNDICFNLSHSKTAVMCAVSDFDIGCDAEKIKDIDLEIAKRFFFSEEYKAISQCNDKSSQNDMFFRYWTLKESFMKATGLGFELPLNEFCINLSDSGIKVTQSVDDREYYFKEFDLSDGFKYAACSVNKPIDDIIPIKIDFNEII